jgi:hypothetical protein
MTTLTNVTVGTIHDMENFQTTVDFPVIFLFRAV